MTYPITDSIIDFKTSCSIEDAVAKLLGWLKGPIYLSSIRVDQPITIEQLENIDTLVFPLKDHLQELKDEAIYKFDDAMSAGASEDVKNSLLKAYGDALDLIARANIFTIDIKEELNKNDESSLVIDKATSEKEGEVFLTLKSLNQWAIEKYGISILDERVLPNRSHIKQKRTRYDQPRLRLQEQKILEMILTLNHDPLNLPKNPSGKPGIKAEIRTKLSKDPIFAGSTVFKKAWDRLLENKEIQQKE